jgi:uncharacterized protein YndB with AHSA1/START domain
MKTHGGRRSTTASPERVWALWSDPDNWNRWNTGIRSSQIDGPLTSGATGTMQTTSGRCPSTLEVRHGILHAA